MPWVANSVWCDSAVPTYELRCPECGHEYERFVMRLLRVEDRVCPECGASRVDVGVGGGFVVRQGGSESACVSGGAHQRNGMCFALGGLILQAN